MKTLRLGNHVNDGVFGSIASNSRSLTLAMTLSVAGLMGCSTTSDMRSASWATTNRSTWLEENLKKPSIANTSEPDIVVEEELLGEKELLSNLGATLISFNGKEEPMPNGIELRRSLTPGNFYIDHPNMRKFMGEPFEVKENGDIATPFVTIKIDPFDFFTLAYVKGKYNIVNGTKYAVARQRNEKWIWVFYINKIPGEKEEATESVAQNESNDPK